MNALTSKARKSIFALIVTLSILLSACSNPVISGIEKFQTDNNCQTTFCPAIIGK